MSKSTFYNFPEVSKSDWWEKIREDLKGQSEDSLFTSLGENLTISPFYNAEDLKSASKAFQNLKKVRKDKAPNDWDLVQSVHPEGRNQDEFNQFVKYAEEGDADYIEIMLSESGMDLKIPVTARKMGLIITSNNADRALKTLKGINADHFREILVDPGYGEIITGRRSADSLNSNISTLRAIKGVNPFVINTDSIVENGGDAVDEGVYLLALLNEMLKANTADQNADIILRLNTGSNFFLEIARIRALRKLSGLILEAWKVENSLRIEVHSTLWNKAVYDRYTNILRNTSESFAALAGGADMLTVRPFESALGIENDFSQRNARNISHLLRHESHIDKVKDVAAGSYFVESLSTDYAREVWNGFLKIEEKGGLENWLKENNVKDAFADKAMKNKALFGKRKLRMIGTNVYPNPLDHLAEDNVKSRRHERLSADFERFRVSLDSLALKNGEKARPSAMLLRLGNSPMRFTRSGFSANFLETAGFRMIEQDGMPENFDDIRLVVICGSDEDYISTAAGWLEEIRKSTKSTLILLAGLPENHESLKAAGVDFFIHIKAPLEKTIEEIFKALNIETA